MRSVIFHLASATRDEVRAYFATLDSIISGGDKVVNEGWVFPPPPDSVIYIRFYNDLEGEFEPEELGNLKAAFGGKLPTVSICADVSGRIVGLDEVTKLSNLILGVFEGFVTDDYSDYLWNLGEIRAGRIIDGLRFFDTEGYYRRRQIE